MVNVTTTNLIITTMMVVMTNYSTLLNVEVTHGDWANKYTGFLQVIFTNKASCCSSFHVCKM